jgi:hypothetical protein
MRQASVRMYRSPQRRLCTLTVEASVRITCMLHVFDLTDDESAVHALHSADSIVDVV